MDDVDWGLLDAFSDRTIFQTRGWLEFLAETQGGEPVVARLEEEGDVAGWFTGMVVRRFGVRILGSPFQGWTTGPMGFNLVDGVDRADALRALFSFAFKKLGCLHVELMDRRLSDEQVDALGVESAPFTTYQVDLTRDEDEIFHAMSSSCRRAIRKAGKHEVRVEQASGAEFADEYYAQLCDVFAKQSLQPPYGVDRVRELIECVEGEDGERLLLLRARTAEGTPIATAIFPVLNDFACFWGGASWREHQILRPNEAIFWHAIRHLKELGVPTLDLGGGGDYKRKYGVREVVRPFVRKSRLSGLLTLRNAAAWVGWRLATRPRLGRRGP